MFASVDCLMLLAWGNLDTLSCSYQVIPNTRSVNASTWYIDIFIILSSIYETTFFECPATKDSILLINCSARTFNA